MLSLNVLSNKRLRVKQLVLATSLIVGMGSVMAKNPTYDVNDLSPDISACDDFNGYANSIWLKNNPVPDDRTRWGAFDALREESLNAQRKLVDLANTQADSKPTNSIEQKIGWLYRSGMDEAAIEKAGFSPIKPHLAEISKLNDSKKIVNWLQQSFARGQGQVFRFGANADFKNAERQIAFANQGGLGLPTPDYYSKPEHQAIRDAYLNHIASLFELTGVSATDAKKKAEQVMALETRLANASLSRVELRDPKNQYQFMDIAAANKITPNFDWTTFFKTVGVPVGEGFSLSQPKFFAEFNQMLTDIPAAEWQNYFAFHTIDDASPYLSKAFQEANFAFYGKTLNGQPQQQDRWKRVLEAVNNGMGQALGQLYVAEYFPPAAKARAQHLVDNVQAALKVRLEGLEWMSDETRAKALEKWSTFLPKIGYPDQWRSWDGLTIKPNDYFGNMQAARQFNSRYQLDKIGQATDRMEWGMTPQTVNAYYSAATNTINFPAAILQPPFFYADGDDAINYGGIGAVIGHEAIHGFDDKGSQFDSVGNNANWWTETDRQKFVARTDKLAKQFNSYVPLENYPDQHVNGQLTMGENIADLGGLAVSLDALLAAEGKTPDPMIDGLTREQRFFLSWARVWRGNIREKAQLVLLNTDPHAPAKYRAIGAPSNMDSFAKAFACKVGDKMVRDGENKVIIW